MRIEKKSNNSFRCVLSAKDLEERQIRLDELAYGSAKARKLFEDMIWEAEEHYGVYLTGEPLAIEAIPLKNEGLALDFSVMEEPEELDFRYSEFTLAGGSRDTDAEVLGADDLLRERSGSLMEIEVPAEPARDNADAGDIAATEELLELPEIPAEEPGGEEELSDLAAEELLEPEEDSDPASMADSIRSQIEEGLRKLFPNAKVESVDMTTVRVSGNEEMDEFHEKLMKAFVDKIREKEAGERDEADEGREGLFSDGVLGEPPAKETDGQRKSARRSRASHNRQSRENLRLYRFASLEDVLAGSANVAFFRGESTLFHGRNGYSLVLRQGSSELKDFNRVCNVLSEYGDGRAATPAAVAYLAEHDQKIFQGDAIRQLMKIEG